LLMPALGQGARVNVVNAGYGALGGERREG